tara:strand:- start:392 stop:1141 length:750 start_codon:yes stop_codon:yes gene_type:complete
MPGAEFLNAFSGTLGDNVLGPKYSYHTKINNPKELGMSPEGKMSALANNVKGLISYVEILVEGGGAANKANMPLGDRFFLKTAAKCKDILTNQVVPRHFYVNNQIDGSIPGLTQLTGFKSGMKGLVIGAMSDMFSINPAGIIKGFVEGGKPWCKAVKKKVINDNSDVSYETHHVALSDLKDSDLTAADKIKINQFKTDMMSNEKASCEGFNNIENIQFLLNKGDMVPKTYVLCFSMLLIYLLYKTVDRK